MTLEVDIDTALMLKAEQIAASLFLPLAVPNRVFEKPDDGRWLRVQHLRNRNTGIVWGDETMFQGILQFDIFGPPDLGSTPTLAIGANIVALLPKGTELREGVAVVKIDEKPSVLSQVEDGQETFVPVSVRYRCFG